MGLRLVVPVDFPRRLADNLGCGHRTLRLCSVSIRVAVEAGGMYERLSRAFSGRRWLTLSSMALVTPGSVRGAGSAADLPRHHQARSHVGYSSSLAGRVARGDRDAYGARDCGRDCQRDPQPAGLGRGGAGGVGLDGGRPGEESWSSVGRLAPLSRKDGHGESEATSQLEPQRFPHPFHSCSRLGQGATTMWERIWVSRVAPDVTLQPRVALSAGCQVQDPIATEEFPDGVAGSRFAALGAQLPWWSETGSVVGDLSWMELAGSWAMKGGIQPVDQRPSWFEAPTTCAPPAPAPAARPPEAPGCSGAPRPVPAAGGTGRYAGPDPRTLAEGTSAIVPFSLVRRTRAPLPLFHIHGQSPQSR